MSSSERAAVPLPAEERLKKLERSVGTLFARVREEHEWTMFMLLDIRKRIGAMTAAEHAEAVTGIWEHPEAEAEF